jgi:hypothetical protein
MGHRRQQGAARVLFGVFSQSSLKAPADSVGPLMVKRRLGRGVAVAAEPATLTEVHPVGER